MNTKTILTQLQLVQTAIEPMINDLRGEHRRLSAMAHEDKQAADEQVSVAAMLLAATRANRELTKVLTAYKWYVERVITKRKDK